MLGGARSSLDRSPRVIVRDDGCLETAIIISSTISTTVSADNPCRTAFCLDWRLPRSVVGPVLRSALRRLASICRNEVMGWWLIGNDGSYILRNAAAIRYRRNRMLRRTFGAIADVGSASPSTANAMALGRACCQSLRAIGSGSIVPFATTWPLSP